MRRHIHCLTFKKVRSKGTAFWHNFLSSNSKCEISLNMLIFSFKQIHKRYLSWESPTRLRPSTLRSWSPAARRPSCVTQKAHVLDSGDSQGKKRKRKVNQPTVYTVFYNYKYQWGIAGHLLSRTRRKLTSLKMILTTSAAPPFTTDLT